MSTRVTPSNIDTVNAFFAARGRGDLDAALAFLTDDVIWRIDGSTTVPTAGIFRGKDAVRRWLSGFPSHFTPRQLSMEKMIEDGDDVLLLGGFRHTVQSTQHTFGGRCIIRFTLRGALIARYEIFEDSYLVARAFDPEDDPEGNRQLCISGNVYALSDRGGFGADATVVFVHDRGQDREVFRTAMAALAERGHRCIAVDIPGHGKSPPPSAGWTTTESLVADLAVLIEELVGAPIVFAGLGLGAHVGERLATTRPDLIAQLAQIDEAEEGGSKIRMRP